MEVNINLIIMTPDLDHPQCIRFISEQEVSRLENIRDFSQTLMRAYLRFAEDQTVIFPNLELTNEAIRQSAEAIFVRPDSPPMNRDLRGLLGYLRGSLP